MPRCLLGANTNTRHSRVRDTKVFAQSARPTDRPLNHSSLCQRTHFLIGVAEKLGEHLVRVLS
jgi:hypothetical protein